MAIILASQAFQPLELTDLLMVMKASENDVGIPQQAAMHAPKLCTEVREVME